MSFISRSFSTNGNLGKNPLTDEQLVALAPSILATQAHESRSEAFRPIPTFEIVTRMRAEGFIPVFAAQSRSRDVTKRDFTKHLIRFRRESDLGRMQRMEHRVGDVFAEAWLVNANDGTSSYNIHSGLFRWRCLNGMVAELPGTQQVRVGHRGSVETVARKVIEGTFEVLGLSDRAPEAANTWAEIDLSRDAQMAFAEAAHAVRFDDPTATPFRPEQLLGVRREGDHSNDLWTTYNRIQENAVRGGLEAERVSEVNGRVTRRRVSTREVNGIGENVKLNRALWMLGERMKTLVAA